MTGTPASRTAMTCAGVTSGIWPWKIFIACSFDRCDSRGAREQAAVALAAVACVPTGRLRRPPDSFALRRQFAHDGAPARHVAAPATQLVELAAQLALMAREMGEAVAPGLVTADVAV